MLYLIGSRSLVFERESWDEFGTCVFFTEQVKAESVTMDKIAQRE